MHFLKKISENVKKLKYLNKAEIKDFFSCDFQKCLNRNGRMTKNA